MKSEEDKIFECFECAYVAKSKTGLISHIRGHPGMEEVSLFKCDECSYVAKRKYVLKRHQGIHRKFHDKGTKCTK